MDLQKKRFIVVNIHLGRRNVVFDLLMNDVDVLDPIRLLLFQPGQDILEIGPLTLNHNGAILHQDVVDVLGIPNAWPQKGFAEIGAAQQHDMIGFPAAFSVVHAAEFGVEFVFQV